MTEPESNKESSRNQLVAMTDPDAFGYLIDKWHKARIAEIEHFMEIPEGTEVEITSGKSIVLTGELREAYLAGLSTALLQIAVLPFGFTSVEVATNGESAVQDDKTA